MPAKAEDAVGDVADSGEEQEGQGQRQHRVDAEQVRHRPVGRREQHRDHPAGEGVANGLQRDGPAFADARDSRGKAHVLLSPCSLADRR